MTEEKMSQALELPTTAAASHVALMKVLMEKGILDPSDIESYREYKKTALDHLSYRALSSFMDDDFSDLSGETKLKFFAEILDEDLNVETINDRIQKAVEYLEPVGWSQPRKYIKEDAKK